MPRSIRLTSVCSTVVMIVEPPGEPTAYTGLPRASSTMVGDIDDRGRLPPAIVFGSVADGVALKSVSSLLSRNPRPGTTMPEPPVCSMVNVYDTTLPQRSEVTRCVVDRPCSLRAGGRTSETAATGERARRRGGLQRPPLRDLARPAVGEPLGQQRLRSARRTKAGSPT